MTTSYSFVTPARASAIRLALPGTLATDMESVAIAQTAWVHSRDFLSVRGISDLCGPLGADDFLTHVDDAAERSAVAVLALLDHWEDRGPRS
jgi:adenosylhomocysteine nucleosidase